AGQQKRTCESSQRREFHFFSPPGPRPTLHELGAHSMTVVRDSHRPHRNPKWPGSSIDWAESRYAAKPLHLWTCGSTVAVRRVNQPPKTIFSGNAHGRDAD